jgi:hypothetical protein
MGSPGAYVETTFRSTDSILTRESKSSLRPARSVSKTTCACARSMGLESSSAPLSSIHSNVFRCAVPMPSLPSQAWIPDPWNRDNIADVGGYQSAALPNFAACFTWPRWPLPRRRLGSHSMSTTEQKAYPAPPPWWSSPVELPVPLGRSITTRPNSIQSALRAP